MKKIGQSRRYETFKMENMKYGTHANENNEYIMQIDIEFEW